MPKILRFHFSVTVLLICTFQNCNALVSSLCLKGVIVKILLDFCMRACIVWFPVRDL